MVAMCCSVIAVSAQTTNTKKPVAKKSVKPATTNNAPQKELTIKLVNDCTKSQMVYTGPKKDVFHGKYQDIGGSSTNTIYVKSGDVVCIMKDKKSVKACNDAKTTTSKMEINE